MAGAHNEDMGRQGGAGAGVQTRQAEPHPFGTPWKPSALQRDYRRVLDCAKEAPQAILDTDNEMLVIQRKDLADFFAALADRFAQLARFSATFMANRGREPGEYAAQTDFPFLAAFSREEVSEFAQDFHTCVLDAAQRRNLEHLEGMLRGWESTAGIYQSPGLLAALSADDDLMELREVFPPSEEQVLAGEAAA
jgi:hypothetical protein